MITQLGILFVAGGGAQDNVFKSAKNLEYSLMSGSNIGSQAAIRLPPFRNNLNKLRKYKPHVTKD